MEYRKTNAMTRAVANAIARPIATWDGTTYGKPDGKAYAPGPVLTSKSTPPPPPKAYESQCGGGGVKNSPMRATVGGGLAQSSSLPPEPPTVIDLRRGSVVIRADQLPRFGEVRLGWIELMHLDVLGTVCHLVDWTTAVESPPSDFRLVPSEDAIGSEVVALPIIRDRRPVPFRVIADSLVDRIAKRLVLVEFVLTADANGIAIWLLFSAKIFAEVAGPPEEFGRVAPWKESEGNTSRAFAPPDREFVGVKQAQEISNNQVAGPIGHLHASDRLPPPLILSEGETAYITRPSQIGHAA